MNIIEKLKSNPPKEKKDWKKYIAKCRDHRMTYREIGNILGISSSRAWHIETGYYDRKVIPN